MRFDHILVPLDLSRRNQRQIEAALTLARQARGRVTLLHVVQRIEGVNDEEVGDFYRRMQRVAARKMAAFGRRFAARGVPAKIAVTIGDGARDIVRHAASAKVGLIVMGSHRVDPSRRGRGWGTISYKVGVLCPCPVLLGK